MFVYWFCIISRIASVSRSLPFFDGTVSGGAAHVVAVVESVGPVKVEWAVFAQSTWNCQTRRGLVKPHTDAKRFGRPAGGAPAWTRALLGSSVNTPRPVIFDGASKDTVCGPAVPASICARLSAHTRTFLKLPLAGKPNMFADM